MLYTGVRLEGARRCTRVPGRRPLLRHPALSGQPGKGFLLHDEVFRMIRKINPTQCCLKVLLLILK